MATKRTETDLILGSSSPYRAAQLAALQLPFRAVSPDVDELPMPGEQPAGVAVRLAQAKSRAIATHIQQEVREHPRTWIIGADQVGALGSTLLGKPCSRENNIAMLQAASGRLLQFYTAIAVLRLVPQQTAEPLLLTACIETRVRFRHLTLEEITRYVELEPAFDCAGGFKSEGLGAALFESVTSTDPSALIGLPMLALCRCLRASGYPLLTQTQD